MPVFFQKWPKPAQQNTLSLCVTTISMLQPSLSFIADDGAGRCGRARATAERGQPAGARPLRHRHHLPRVQHPQSRPQLPRG